MERICRLSEVSQVARDRVDGYKN